MNKLFRPKCLRRVLLCLALLFPIVYLCGGLFFSLAGMHGNNVFAQEEAVLSTEGSIESITYYQPIQGDVIYSNYYKIDKLKGHSYVDDGEITETIFNSFTNGIDSYSLPSIPLRSNASNIFDSISNDGTFIKRISVVNIIDSSFGFDSEYVYVVNSLYKTYEISTALCNNLTYANKGSIVGDELYKHFYVSGAGLLELYRGTMSIEEFRSYYSDTYFFMEARTYETTQLDTTFDYNIKNYRNQYIEVNSTYPSYLDLFIPNYVDLIEVDLSDYIFSQPFANNNFVTSLGKDLINGSTKGFNPMNELFRTINTNIMHFDDSDGLAMFGFGYVYYAVNVLIVYEILILAVKLIMLPLKAVDLFDKEDKL